MHIEPNVYKFVYIMYVTCPYIVKVSHCIKLRTCAFSNECLQQSKGNKYFSNDHIDFSWLTKVSDRFTTIHFMHTKSSTLYMTPKASLKSILLNGP